MDDSEFSPCEEVYIPQVDIEDLEEYRPGGFHPVMLGDLYQARYRVIHKLGFGGYSTIWLACDEVLNRGVALKILTAEESQVSNEAAILGQLRDDHSTHVGAGAILVLFDYFFLEGPNGRHLCLVEELAGYSLSTCKKITGTGLLPIETARSLVAQLIIGLDYLHSRDVCHGDLHLNNFLLRMPCHESIEIDDVYRLYGEPYTTPVHRIDGRDVAPHAPSHVTHATSIPPSLLRDVDPEVIIADYGTSFVVTQCVPRQLSTPALSLPPEDSFDEPITQAADIWTLGVNFYELLGDCPLFEVNTSADGDDILHKIFSILGRPPQRWWDQWTNRVKGRRQSVLTVSHTLRRRLGEVRQESLPEPYQWNERRAELQAFGDLLEGMVVYEPAKRLTAKQLMQAEYMTKWALPAWERQQQRKQMNHERSAARSGSSVGREG